MDADPIAAATASASPHPHTTHYMQRLLIERRSNSSDADISLPIFSGSRQKKKKKKKKLIPFSRYFFPQSLLLSCSLNRIRLKRWCSSLLHLDKMNIGKKKCSVFATSPWVYKSWLKKPHEAAWKSKSGPGRRSTDGQKGGRKEREKKHFLFFIFGNNYHPVVAWHGQRYCTQQQLK